jgi:hypothetical protein
VLDIAKSPEKNHIMFPANSISRPGFESSVCESEAHLKLRPVIIMISHGTCEEDLGVNHLMQQRLLQIFRGSKLQQRLRKPDDATTTRLEKRQIINVSTLIIRTLVREMYSRDKDLC